MPSGVHNLRDEQMLQPPLVKRSIPARQVSGPNADWATFVGLTRLIRASALGSQPVVRLHSSEVRFSPGSVTDRPVGDVHRIVGVQLARRT